MSECRSSHVTFGVRIGLNGLPTRAGISLRRPRRSRGDHAQRLARGLDIAGQVGDDLTVEGDIERALGMHVEARHVQRVDTRGAS
jgi:hypothetical protein